MPKIDVIVNTNSNNQIIFKTLCSHGDLMCRKIC